MKISTYKHKINYNQCNKKSFVNSLKESYSNQFSSNTDFIENEMLYIKKDPFYDEMNTDMLAQIIHFRLNRFELTLQNISRYNRDLQYVMNFYQMYNKIYN